MFVRSNENFPGKLKIREKGKHLAQQENNHVMASIYHIYRDPCFCPGWIGECHGPRAPLDYILVYRLLVWAFNV